MAIQRRLIARLGRRCPRTGLRDAPSPAAVAAAAPAELAALDLAPTRALTLRRAAAEVAAGRVDLLAADPMPGWRRLRAIPGIGPWTLEMLAYYGQGHHDRLPAGDLGYIKLVGRITTGHPKARAERGGGARVLRPLRRVEGARGRVRPRRPPPAACSAQSCSSALRGSSPSPGRNSFVSTRSAVCGCVSRPSSSIQSM